MVQFSQMLKNERMRLGLTQDEIARFCGVSKRTYNYYEDGERAASSDFLMAFSKLGADINYLFTGCWHLIVWLKMGKKLVLSLL